jgi:hypothetical protein
LQIVRETYLKKNPLKKGGRLVEWPQGVDPEATGSSTSITKKERKERKEGGREGGMERKEKDGRKEGRKEGRKKLPKYFLE